MSRAGARPGRYHGARSRGQRAAGTRRGRGGAPAATAIAEWHSRFHDTVEELFERQLPGEIPAPARAQEAAAATFALEGALIHDLDPTTTRRLCGSVAERLEQASRAAGRPASR